MTVSDVGKNSDVSDAGEEAASPSGIGTRALVARQKILRLEEQRRGRASVRFKCSVSDVPRRVG